MDKKLSQLAPTIHKSCRSYELQDSLRVITRGNTANVDMATTVPASSNPHLGVRSHVNKKTDNAKLQRLANCMTAWKERLRSNEGNLYHELA